MLSDYRRDYINSKGVDKWWDALNEFMDKKFSYDHKNNFDQFYTDVLSISQSFDFLEKYNFNPDTAYFLSVLTDLCSQCSDSFEISKYLNHEISSLIEHKDFSSLFNEISKNQYRYKCISENQINSETYGNIAVDYVRKLFGIPKDDDTRANMSIFFQLPLSVSPPSDIIVFSSPYLESKDPLIFTGVNTLAIYNATYWDFTRLGGILKKCTLSPTDITVLQLDYSNDSIFTSKQNKDSVFSSKLKPIYDIEINDCNLFISEFNSGHNYKNMCDIPRYDDLSSEGIYKPKSLGHFNLNYTNNYSKFVSRQANKVVLNYFQSQLPYLDYKEMK